MASCSFSVMTGSQCGPSPENRTMADCVVSLKECTKDIKPHLKLLEVRDASLDTEMKLLLARVGK